MQFYHSRPTVNILKTAAVCAALLALLIFFRSTLAQILSLLFGSCVFAFLFTPLSRLLEKKLPRPAAVLLSIGGTCILLCAALVLLAPLLLRQMSTLVHLLPDAFLRLQALTEGMTAQLQLILPEFSPSAFSFSGMEGLFSDVARNIAGAIGTAAGKIYRVILMGALSYFLMADREGILLRLELLIPERFRRMTVRAGNMFLRDMRLYLRGQATIALAVGILAASALTIIGIPGSPLLGIFVGMFNIIPYLGPFLGGIPAVVMALSISWQKAAFTVLSLFLVQQIDGMVISPRVMGNITGFSPAVVLLAIFVGARIGSIGGMLFALPSLMAVRTVYRVFVQRHENN